MSTSSSTATPPAPTPSTSKNPPTPTPIVCCHSAQQVRDAIGVYTREGDVVLELGSEFGAVSQRICATVGPTGHAVLVDRIRSHKTSGNVRNPLTYAAQFRPPRLPAAVVGQTKTTLTSDNEVIEKEVNYADRAELIQLDALNEWKQRIFPVQNNNKNINPLRRFDVIVLTVGHLLGHDLYLTMLSMAWEILDAVARVPQQRDSIATAAAAAATNTIHRPKAVVVKSKTLHSLSRRLVHAQRLFDGTTVLPQPPSPTEPSHPDNIDSNNDKNCTKSSWQEQQLSVSTPTIKSPPPPPAPFFVASVRVEEYRRTIPFCVRPTDVCLEVGCHFGRTTQLLDEAGRVCHGVDVGPSIIEHARRQYPHLHFSVGDAWRTLDLLRVRHQQARIESNVTAATTNTAATVLGYDIVYADIGGLSGADGVLESLALLDALGQALQPRVIVIKSLCLRQLASRLKCFGEIWRKIQSHDQD